MQNNVKIFNNAEFGDLRTVEIDNVVWFIGIDVAKILGYKLERKAISDHVDKEDMNTVPIRNGKRGNPNQIIINESGLYSLILSSKLPTAKKFKHWVTSEVLPSIRKHGAYMTPETIEEAILNPDTIIKIASKLKEEQEKNKALSTTNAALTGNIQSWDAKSVINALIRKYSGLQCGGDFAKAWAIYYKKLLYKGHMNLKARQKKRHSKLSLMDMINPSEYPLAVQIATAMCEDGGVDTAEILKMYRK